MTDYYMGIVVGGAIGYCLALITLVTIWGLCVVAKREEEERRDKETENC